MAQLIKLRRHRRCEDANEGGLLAAVQVSLQTRANLLCALTLSSQTTATLASAGLAACGSAGVTTASNPAQLLVSLDYGVTWVEHDDLVEFVSTVLANPVGIENLEVRVLLGGTLLSDTLNGLRHGDFEDTSL